MPRGRKPDPIIFVEVGQVWSSTRLRSLGHLSRVIQIEFDMVEVITISCAPGKQNLGVKRWLTRTTLKQRFKLAGKL